MVLFKDKKDKSKTKEGHSKNILHN